MRVLFLTHNYIRYPGDHAGGFLHRLAKELLNTGVEVTVLAPHCPGRSCFEIIDGVKIYRFRYAPERFERIAYSGEMHRLVSKSPLDFLLFVSFMLFFLFKGIQLALEERAEVLSAQWWIPAGVVAFVVSLLTGRRFVLTTHGTDVRLLSDSSSLRAIARPVFAKASGVTTVSTFLKERLRHHLPLAPEQIEVIPMPPGVELFEPRPLPQNETKVILNVSHFTRQKRLDVFIEACGKLNERGYRFKALCVGGGPLKAELKKLIADLTLEDSVELRGAVTVDEVADLYHRCDLCVLCSEEEGFGLTLVEAQLCGRPVIGADSGGIPDIIRDGASGLLVPVGDSDALANAICRVFDDPELTSELASRGLASAKEKFSPERLSGLYLSILSQTAESGRRQ